MFAISLGDDGAELRPLEPWRAEEFLAHMDRGRDFIGQYIGLAAAATDVESARAFLQSYAEKQAADAGRIYGIWLDGTLVGGVLFRIFDAASGNCEAGCWLEPSAAGRGLVTRAIRVLIDWAVERARDAPRRVGGRRCEHGQHQCRQAAGDDAGRGAAGELSRTGAYGTTWRSGRCWRLSGGTRSRRSLSGTLRQAT